MLRSILAATVALAVLSGSSIAAVRGNDTQYVGGTVGQIPRGAEGALSLDDKTELVFSYGKGQAYKVPYDQINTLEFGQKVGRRVGLTLALGITVLGLAALPILLSKKKQHFLSIGFTEADGTNGAIVLELSKGNAATVLTTLEARTGKKVESADGSEGPEKMVASAGRIQRENVTRPQPHPPAFASLAVSSAPAGADIEIDGHFVGNAPSTLQVPAGKHRVMVRKSGHIAWVRELDIADGATLSLAADLEPMQQDSPSVITIRPRQDR
jgi:hypothetical protein